MRRTVGRRLHIDDPADTSLPESDPEQASVRPPRPFPSISPGLTRLVRRKRRPRSHLSTRGQGPGLEAEADPADATEFYRLDPLNFHGRGRGVGVDLSRAAMRHRPFAGSDPRPRAHPRLLHRPCSTTPTLSSSTLAPSPTPPRGPRPDAPSTSPPRLPLTSTTPDSASPAPAPHLQPKSSSPPTTPSRSPFSTTSP